MKKYAWLLLPLSGVLMGLCLAFPVLGVLEWIAMVPALLFLFTVAPKREVGYRRLYLFGFCYYFFFYKKDHCFFDDTLKKKNYYFLSN